MGIWKRLATALCAALILGGCAKGGAPAQGDNEGTTRQQAKGRYMEEELTFPKEVLHLYDLRMAEDGALEIFAYIEGYTFANYRSADGGTTWKKNEPAWFKTLINQGNSINNAFYMADGGVIVNVFTNGEGEISDYRIMADGTAIPLEGLPADQSGSGINGVTETESGDLLFSTYFSLHQTGSLYEEKSVYPIDGLVTGNSFAVLGDTLAICDGNLIRFYSLTDGSLKTELSQEGLGQLNSEIHFSGDLSKPPRVITADKGAEAFYFCDATGIYRRLADGTVSERLIDGELCSLSMPSVNPQQLLLLPDGGFLVWSFTDDRNTLLRYRYDPDALTEPTTELKLYMLRDNKTVRQAVGMFQRQNPEVKVTCEVGAADAASEQDALRAFNTRLLAGDGPDLMTLDGMPVDSFIEKGVLADLSDAQEATIKTLLPNVAGTFQKENGLYALPARFSVTMLALPANAEGVTDLDSLVTWVEGQENARLQCTVPDGLIRLLYPVMSPGWFREDGTLDKEALSRSLTLLKRMSAITGWSNKSYLEDMAKGESEPGNLEFGAVALAGDGLSAVMGPIYRFQAAASVDAAIKKMGGGSMAPLAGEKGAVFIPSAILGVNTNGKQQALAQEFLSFALSAQVQQYKLDDGLPSNREALAQNAANPYTEEEIESGMGSYYSVSEQDENGDWEVYELNMLWPSEAFMDGLIEDLEAIETASPEDAVTLQMVLSETADYFSGNKTLEETVDAFAQKADIRLAE